MEYIFSIFISVLISTKISSLMFEKWMCQTEVLFRKSFLKIHAELTELRNGLRGG